VSFSDSYKNDKFEWQYTRFMRRKMLLKIIIVAIVTAGSVFCYTYFAVTLPYITGRATAPYQFTLAAILAGAVIIFLVSALVASPIVLLVDKVLDAQADMFYSK